MRALSRNPLASRHSFPLHPDPSGPIFITRTGRNAMGPGHYRTTAGKSAGSGRGSGVHGEKTRAYVRHYRTTAVTRAYIAYAPARLRPHVMGSVCFFGSRVVERDKALFPKGKCHYLAHYFANTCQQPGGSSVSNPLKSFKKGGI